MAVAWTIACMVFLICTQGITYTSDRYWHPSSGWYYNFLFANYPGFILDDMTGNRLSTPYVELVVSFVSGVLYANIIYWLAKLGIFIFKRFFVKSAIIR